MRRIVIELRQGDGPMAGRFLADGQRSATEFSSWLALTALLEAARRAAPIKDKPNKEESR